MLMFDGCSQGERELPVLGARCQVDLNADTMLQTTPYTYLIPYSEVQYGGIFSFGYRLWIPPVRLLPLFVMP